MYRSNVKFSFKNQTFNFTSLTIKFIKKVVSNFLIPRSLCLIFLYENNFLFPFNNAWMAKCNNTPPYSENDYSSSEQKKMIIHLLSLSFHKLCSFKTIIRFIE